jgi:hypothetical protein
MSKTTIPGIKARHAIVTDTCRANRGNDGVIDEVFDRLRDSYLAASKGWPVGNGAKFHFVLTVERPVAEGEAGGKGEG